jgi:HSP20 family molecular chaperone IbpA
MPAVDIHEYADRFELLVDLPDTVDSKKVRATGSNGVLEISIAKQPKAQPRRISVTS